MDPNQPADQPQQDLMISPEDALSTTAPVIIPPAPPEEVSYTPPQAWGADQSAPPAVTPTTPSPTFSATLPLTDASLTPPPAPPSSPVLPPSAPLPPLTPPPTDSGSPVVRHLLTGLALTLFGTLLGVLAARFLPPVSAPAPLPSAPAVLTTPGLEPTIIPATDSAVPEATSSASPSASAS